MDYMGLLWDLGAVLFKDEAPLLRFLKRLTSEDDIVVVTTSHLLSEYALDRIIEEKLKQPNIILKDRKNFSYSVKLNMLYCTGYLPDPLYKNLTSLNRLRNSYAHNLRPDPKVMSFLEYPKLNGKINYEQSVTETKCSDPKDPFYYHLFLIELCTTTLFMCLNHASSLNVKIPFDELIGLSPK